MVVTNTAQLSLFSTIRTALLDNPTIYAYFSTDTITQFKPKEKSATFKGFPYIQVSFPETSTDLLVLSHENTIKDFEVTLSLVMEYLARDNYLTIANAIIYALEHAESTFDTASYHNLKIELIGTDDNYVTNQKECIRGEFSLRLTGTVWR